MKTPCMNELLVLKPVLKEYIWGGRRLKTEFGYEIPSDKTGECWAISAFEGAESEVISGTYAGKRLSTLWKENPELFGSYPAARFPLLVKIIDAEDDLSVQVHPDNDYARVHENGSSGKRECWYVLDCRKDAAIVIGHLAKDKADMEKMIRTGDWKHFLREVPIRKGDFFQISPGCLHAIKGGTLILETQQNSNVTYRVYDYGRLQNGKPRQLHVQQSIDCITVPFRDDAERKPHPEETSYGTYTHFIDTPEYSVDRYEITGTMKEVFDHPFTNVSIIEGRGDINNIPVKKGTHLIIPNACGTTQWNGDFTAIVSYPPEIH